MNSHAVGVIFRDLLMGLLGIMIMVLFVVLVQVQAVLKEVTEGMKPPGTVNVMVVWPQGDTDVDLWVKGPGESQGVGYSAPNGILFNLLRDDLGTQPDLTNINMESSISRGAPAGEYIINLHCYRCPTAPFMVNVEVSLNKEKPGSKPKVLFTATADLMNTGQERTVMRFHLDANGDVVPNSMDFTFTPIRTPPPKTG